MRIAPAVILALLTVAPGLSFAQEKAGPAELRAAKVLADLRGDPLALHEFLKRMPKGADLHIHLHGAVFAETLIKEAIEDKLCVDEAAHAFAKPQSTTGDAPGCEEGAVPAAKVLQIRPLYNGLIDAFSMRNFVASEGESGQDHFFGAYTKFGGVDPSHTGEWLDEVAGRAAAQNMQYLELMATPTWNRLNFITKDVAWREDLADLRQELLAKGLTEDIPAARQFWDDAEAKRRALGQCGQQDETPGCKVALRYVYEIFRNNPKELVFAEALFGFELASADPRVVAINFVGEEDGPDAMADYAEHMRMVGFLRTLYPRVRVSLHAGELAPGLVPPEGLCCHIRLAVEEAGTDRIGHGSDVMYEDRPYELLRTMADRGVLAEINLTSNDMILGMSGNRHPFATYRKFGVPVALSTDDPGIERIDLTDEYVRAVTDYGLTYAEIKDIVRNSLEYSFLPGSSLWAKKGDYSRRTSECDNDVPSMGEPSAPCASVLAASEKAAQEWDLERRFQAFEASF
jgi:adenosine deaminase